MLPSSWMNPRKKIKWKWKKISNNKKIFTFSNHWFFAHCTNEALIMPSKFFKSNEFGISKTTFSWKIEKKDCKKNKKSSEKEALIFWVLMSLISTLQVKLQNDTIQIHTHYKNTRKINSNCPWQSFCNSTTSFLTLFS